MLVTGDFIDAARARELGLVNASPRPTVWRMTPWHSPATSPRNWVPPSRSANAPSTTSATCRLAEAYALTGAVMAENMLWRDTEEGINAFLEKRKPDWPQ